MISITQDVKFRLSLLKYAENIRAQRQLSSIRLMGGTFIWKRHYEGSIESFRERSCKLHHHPKQHSPKEIKRINDMRRRNPNNGLVIFGIKLMRRGYTRSIPSVYYFLRKQGSMAVYPPSSKYIPKPYEQM